MPQILESEKDALIRLIQIATILSGRKPPSASTALAMLAESKSVDVSLLPINPEPGLDSVVILNFELKEARPCR